MTVPFKNDIIYGHVGIAKTGRKINVVNKDKGTPINSLYPPVKMIDGVKITKEMYSVDSS